MRALAPQVAWPRPEELKDKTLRLPLRYDESDLTLIIPGVTEPRSALISLAPLETMTIFFMVCLVAGLVLASPWVFYQGWAFVAAGLYRHERHYVHKFLPMSLGLFLTGVFACFFGVLPITMKFLLNFNVWLGIEPTLRLVDWMSFATLLPLVFGLCFQTPLIMLFLERIGIFTVDDYRAKRRIAILIIFIAGAVLTPGQDPVSMCMLALPMVLLYELGILLVRGGVTAKTKAGVAG
jgi:sec-independent protein translocase protein TatC